MTTGIERELKFAFNRKDVRAVRAALEAEAQGAPENRRLASHYFDTDDDYLWRHSATLRLRDDGNCRVQTFKRERSSTLDRDEYEATIDQDKPDLAAFDGARSRLLKKAQSRGELHQTMDVDVSREISCIARNGARIEAALDLGEIRSGGGLLPFSELELELKEGGSDGLFELAHELCAAAPIAFSPVSKAEKGQRLAKGEWARPFKGKTPDIRRTMEAGAVLQMIAHRCLHSIALNLIALDGPDRTEAVHQGRVALRRLRAALQLFRPLAQDGDYRRLDDELKWISHVFGEARDLDVFQEGTFAPAASAGDLPGADELAERTAAARALRHAALDEAVSSPRLRLLLVDLVAWLTEGDWRHADSARLDQPIETFARRALRKKFRKFLERAKDFESFDEEAQHKVRIRAKKLRYMAAFFEARPRIVARRGQLAPLLKRLETMQNCLGEIHDEQAKADFIARQISDLPPGAPPLAGYAAGRLASPDKASDSKKMESAVKAYVALAQSDPF